MKVCFRVEKTKFNGKDYSFNNYYLVFDNGSSIAIRPNFKKDYSKLRIVAQPMEK